MEVRTVNEKIEIKGGIGGKCALDFSDRDKPIKVEVCFPNDAEILAMLTALEMSAISIVGYAKSEQTDITDITDPMRGTPVNLVPLDAPAKPKRGKKSAAANADGEEVLL